MMGVISAVVFALLLVLFFTIRHIHCHTLPRISYIRIFGMHLQTSYLYRFIFRI